MHWVSSHLVFCSSCVFVWCCSWKHLATCRVVVVVAVVVVVVVVVVGGGVVVVVVVVVVVFGCLLLACLFVIGLLFVFFSMGSLCVLRSERRPP